MKLSSKLLKSHVRVILKPISLTDASIWRSKKPGIQHRVRVKLKVKILWLCSS